MRFGLRSLFCTVTIIAAVAALMRCRMTSQNAALTAVLSHGGHVVFACEASIALQRSGSSAPVDPGSWRTLLFRNPVAVNVHTKAFSDDDVALLRHFRRLQRLELQSTSITDRAMADIGSLPDLRIILLSGTNVTGAGILKLRDCPIEELHVNDMSLTDADLASISQLRGLRHLRLNGNRITDAGVAFLTQLPQLERLSLYNTEITSRGIKQLESLSKLRELACNTGRPGRQAKRATARSELTRSRWSHGLCQENSLFRFCSTVSATDMNEFSRRHPSCAVNGSTWAEKQAQDNISKIAAKSKKRRPNILFVLTDDQPLGCMGCIGNQEIQTPNLDRLAADGMLFTNCFVTTSICCSNRACILTGQHMRRHGIRDFHKPLTAAAMQKTYPVLLRKAGYRTGYLGKFAVGWPSPGIKNLSLPADQFDYWYGFPQTINFRQEVDGKPRYLTTLMEEKAIEFLRGQPKDQPFCLTVSIKEPHGPWNYFDPDAPNPYHDAHISPPATFNRKSYEAMPEFVRKSLGGRQGPQWFRDPKSLEQRARLYYRLVTRADLALGRIMAALKETGLDENTVLIYSSDNGDMMGAHGLVGKWLMYEESIRVPLVIRDPRLPASVRGKHCDKMVLSIDLAPTMLAFAGVPTPERMQGRNLMPLVEKRPVTWRSDWYYEHTYAHLPQHPIPKTEGVRAERWKYIRYTDFQPPVEQLFDLAKDPREEHDLAGTAECKATLDQLRKRCDEYRSTLR